MSIRPRNFRIPLNPITSIPITNIKRIFYLYECSMKEHEGMYLITQLLHESII